MTPWDSMILSCYIFIRIPFGQISFPLSKEAPKAERFRMIELDLTFMREIVLKAASGIP